LKGRDGTWALLRTHQPDFKAKLDRISKDSRLLRQRDNARCLLFIAEMLGVDLEEEIRKKAIEEPEFESENATIIEAIEADPIYQQAKVDNGEVVVDELRLRIERQLHDARELFRLSREHFNAVLEEMGYSKKKGPTWRRSRKNGRDNVVILPGLLSLREPATAHTSTTATEMRDGGSGGSGAGSWEEAKGTLFGIVEAVSSGKGGASVEDITRLAVAAGLDIEAVPKILRMLKDEGKVWEPESGIFRPGEGSL
jgi:hypothetical protein